MALDPLSRDAVIKAIASDEQFRQLLNEQDLGILVDVVGDASQDLVTRLTRFDAQCGPTTTKFLLSAISLWESRNKANLLSRYGASTSPLQGEREQFTYTRGLINLLQSRPDLAGYVKKSIPIHSRLLFGVGENEHLMQRLQTFLQSGGKELVNEVLGEALGYAPDLLIREYAPYWAVGEVVTLPADPIVFKQFMQEHVNWVYNRFSVTITQRDSQPVWLVFFA